MPPPRICTQNTAIANMLHSAAYQSFSSNMTVEITVHKQTSLLCTLQNTHVGCFFLEMQTVKPFIVPEMTLKGHSRLFAMPTINSSPQSF